MPSYVFSDQDLNKLRQNLMYASAVYLAGILAFILLLLLLHRAEPHTSLWFLALVPSFVGVGYICNIFLVYIPRLMKDRPKELKPEEQRQVAAKETELFDQLSKLTKAKAEYLKAEIERVKFDSQLSAATGGTPAPHEIPKEILELKEKLDRLTTFDRIQKMLQKHRQKFPAQAEFVDALEDTYRERFLRKEH